MKQIHYSKWETENSHKISRRGAHGTDGKLPTKLTVVFYEDTIYGFDQNTFKIGSKISKGNMKYDATITSNIYNYKYELQSKVVRVPLVSMGSRTLGLTLEQVLNPYTNQQA